MDDSDDALALEALRRDYESGTLAESDLRSDPIAQFRDWLAIAIETEVLDANACVVATAAADGRPSSRTMLLKDLDERGFAFFTNLESRKGQDIAANPHAALTFLWKPLHRQVQVTGSVVRISDDEADRYFASRPRNAQLAAWASPQSTVLADREALEARYDEAVERYDGRAVPRPAFWGGFRVVPATVEFWQGRANRLHDRLRYRRQASTWLVERLSP